MTVASMTSAWECVPSLGEVCALLADDEAAILRGKAPTSRGKAQVTRLLNRRVPVAARFHPGPDIYRDELAVEVTWSDGPRDAAPTTHHMTLLQVVEDIPDAPERGRSASVYRIDRELTMDEASTLLAAINLGLPHEIAAGTLPA